MKLTPHQRLQGGAVLLLAAAWMLPAVFSLFALAPDAEEPSISKRSLALLEKLRTASHDSLAVKWNSDTQTPEWLAGELTSPSRHSPGWIAYAFLDQVKGLYDLRRVKEDLKIMAVETKPSSTLVHMQRMLFNQPVCGDRLLVALDPSGVIQRIEGALHTGLAEKRLNRPMYAAITSEEARQAVLAFDPSLRANDMTGVNVCYMPDRTGIPLVYKVTFEKEKRPVTFKVHSMTGRLIE